MQNTYPPDSEIRRPIPSVMGEKITLAGGTVAQPGGIKSSPMPIQQPEKSPQSSMIEQTTLFGDSSRAVVRADLVNPPETRVELSAARSLIRTVITTPGGVKKPMEAVLIKPRDTKLGLLSRKLFNFFLAYAQRGHVTSEGYYSIPLAQLISDMGYNSRNYAHLRECIEHLAGTVVSWGVGTITEAPDEAYRWSAAALVSYVSIEGGPGKSPEVIFDFHKEIRNLLVNPAVYAFISLEQIAKLSTVAALVLLEIANRYKTNKNGLSKRLPWLEWLIILTGNPHLPAKPEYKYFARDVLLPALKEVNSVQTDFLVELIVHRAGRRVDQLQFKITQLKRPEAPPTLGSNVGPQLDHSGLQAVVELKKAGVTQTTAEQLLTGYPEEEVRAALTSYQTRQNNPRLEPVKSVSAYLKKVLENNAHPKAAVEDSTLKRVRPTLNADETVSGRIKREYMIALKAEQLALYYEAIEEDRKGTLARFEQEKLPSLPTPVTRIWQMYKASKDYGSEKEIPKIVEVLFKDWLAEVAILNDEVFNSDARLTDWAYQKGILKLA